MDKEKVEAALDAARRGVLAIMKNEKRQFFEVAKMIKIEFDKKFGGAWHVLVGKHFGAYVTHEVRIFHFPLHTCVSGWRCKVFVILSVPCIALEACSSA